MYSVIVASPSRRTTNRPWKGHGYVSWHVFTPRHYAKRGICRRRVSVCLCVCLTHSGIVSKIAKRRITQITPYDSPGTLVVLHQSSRRNSNGITPHGGDKCRWGGLNFVTFDEQESPLRQRDRATRLSVKILRLQNIPIVWHYLRILHLAIFTQYRSVTDAHTHRDGRTDTRRWHVLR